MQKLHQEEILINDHLNTKESRVNDSMNGGMQTAGNNTSGLIVYDNNSISIAQIEMKNIRGGSSSQVSGSHIASDIRVESIGMEYNGGKSDLPPIESNKDRGTFQGHVL